MTQIVNIDFRNGELGPSAQLINGFANINQTLGGSVSFGAIQSQGRLGGGYGARIISDGRGYGTVIGDPLYGRTVIEGFDDSPLNEIANNTGDMTARAVTSHPARVQDGDNWWYTFSFKISSEGANGTAWAKGNNYEPIIWQMQPVGVDQYSGTVDTSSGYLLNSPFSFSIDNATANPFTTTKTPHLYLNNIAAGTVGSDIGFFNNNVNFVHNDLSPIDFDTWYDVKFNVAWDASGVGSTQVWLKNQIQKSFADQPILFTNNIQTVAQIGSVPVEGFMRVGYNANLGGSVNANNMQNVLYFDNIVAGNNESDVDLFVQDLNIPGNVLFDGGWDQALSAGAIADYTEVLASDWTNYFAAPYGIPVTGPPIQSGLVVGQTGVYLEYAISAEGDETYNSPYAARFELHPGDMDGFMERVEVWGGTINFPTNNANYSWSTYLDNSIYSINSPIMFTGMMSNGYPHDAPPVGLYANSGSVYLQVNQYSSQTSTPTAVVPWGADITDFINQWSNFAITSTLRTTNGAISLSINNTPQLMNYPFGTANGNAGYNTYTYTGPTARPSNILGDLPIAFGGEVYSSSVTVSDSSGNTWTTDKYVTGGVGGVLFAAHRNRSANSQENINITLNTESDAILVLAQSKPNTTASIIQVAGTATVNTSPVTVNLSQIPTPGNVLLMGINDPFGGNGFPAGFTALANAAGNFSWTDVGYRIVQTGDGTAWTYTSAGNYGGYGNGAVIYEIANATGNFITNTISGASGPLTATASTTNNYISLYPTQGIRRSPDPTANAIVYHDNFKITDGNITTFDNGADGITNGTNNIFTSSTGNFVPGIVGQQIYINGTAYTITGYNSGTSLTYSGAPIAATSNITWTIPQSYPNQKIYIDQMDFSVDPNDYLKTTFGYPTISFTPITQIANISGNTITFPTSSGSTTIQGGNVTTVALNSGTVNATVVNAGTVIANVQTINSNTLGVGTVTANVINAGTVLSNVFSGTSLNIVGLATAAGLIGGTASIGTASMGSVSIGTATIGSALITTETINTSSIGTASITSGTVFNFSSTATSGTTTIVGGTHQALSSSGTSNIYPGSGTFNLSSGTTIITGGTVNAPNHTSSLTEYQVVQSYLPTAFWQLNEVSGNITDYSGNGYTGTATNVGYGSPGPGVNSIGNAAYFNGSSSQVIANPSGLTNKNTTIVAWFKPGGGNGSAGPVIAVGSNYKIADGDGFSFGIGNTSYQNTGTNFIGLFANKRYISTGVGISTATWHMGAMVLNSSGYPSLYLDGQLVYSDSIGTAFNPSGGSVTIGHDNTNNTGINYFNGYIADAAIFNTALTATQIANLYQTTSSIYGGSGNFSSINAGAITTNSLIAKSLSTKLTLSSDVTGFVQNNTIPWNSTSSYGGYNNFNNLINSNGTVYPNLAGIYFCNMNLKISAGNTSLSLFAPAIKVNGITNIYWVQTAVANYSIWYQISGVVVLGSADYITSTFAANTTSNTIAADPTSYLSLVYLGHL